MLKDNLYNRWRKKMGIKSNKEAAKVLHIGHSKAEKLSAGTIELNEKDKATMRGVVATRFMEGIIKDIGEIV